MWELVLSQVHVEWRVIYMNRHCLLDVPVDSLWLPVNNGETFMTYLVSCRVAMVVNRGLGLDVFLEPVPKGSARFLYILFWTVDVWAFKSIYDSTLLTFAVPVLVDMRSVLWYWSPWNVHYKIIGKWYQKGILKILAFSWLYMVLCYYYVVL